jgi:hypothetical protein
MSLRWPRALGDVSGQRVLSAVGLVSTLAGCSAEPASPAETIGEQREALPITTTKIEVHFSSYWFDEGFDALDDRDFHADVVIDGSATSPDLEPGCCDGTSAIATPRPSNASTHRDGVAADQGPIAVRIGMKEADSGADDTQDIADGPDTAIDLWVNPVSGEFTGDLTPFPGCEPKQGCTACTDPTRGDGLCFTIKAVNSCTEKSFIPSSDLGNFQNPCDGEDNDCDGLVDEDYVPPPPTCGLCTTPNACVDGTEIKPCGDICSPAVMVPSEWFFYNNAWDFDVANDRLCVIQATAPIGHITCTDDASASPQYVEVPTPSEFQDTCNASSCSNFLSMDPIGGIFAASPRGIYASQGGADLVRIAALPDDCDRLLQIEQAGPADRAYFGRPRARPFVLCGSGVGQPSVTYELVPEENRWIRYGAAAASMGSAPSRAFETFLAIADTQGTGYYRASTPGSVERLLSMPEPSASMASVGGVYVMPRTTTPFIRQWNGTNFEGVADLGAPFSVPGPGVGYYPALAPPFTDSAPDAPPRKIVEGGGLGVGGPSTQGKTDVLWVLNGTFRIYAYELAPVSEYVKLAEDDHVPLTAQAQFRAGFTPEAQCQDVALATDATCTAVADATMVNGGSSDPNGDALAVTLNAPGRFPRGATPVVLRASDGTTAATCSATVTVTDQTPPALVLPPNVNAGLCASSGLVNVGTATATDACGAAVSGSVIATNGVPLAVPIPVVNGTAELGLGTHTVRWTASDGANEVSGEQTVVVGTTLEAGVGFVVGDRARVRTADGSGATIFSAGTSQTTIGSDARTGAIVSRAAVRVLDRAVVSGPVLSAASVTVAPTAVSGPVTQFGSVSLPPLPSLPAFPPANRGSFTVNSTQTHSPAPGSYVDAGVNSFGTLVLASGDYYFRTLAIQANALIRVGAGTQIFVMDQLALRSPFTLATGAIAPVFLGLSGAATTIEAPFFGKLVAPNAHVTFGNGSGITFTGSLLARLVEVRPNNTLVCDASQI